MTLVPMNIDEAKRYVTLWHRHLKAPVGAKFAIGAEVDGRIVGVALVGRPIARMERHDTAEVIRVATDGTRNACSFLYARAKRAAQALGYRRVITKTLPEEGGASLRAVGALSLGETTPNPCGWNRRGRERANVPAVTKQRWEL